jgi:hypothetical protein
MFFTLPEDHNNLDHDHDPDNNSSGNSGQSAEEQQVFREKEVDKPLQIILDVADKYPHIRVSMANMQPSPCPDLNAMAKAKGIDNKPFHNALSLPSLATIDSLTISNGMRGSTPVFTVPEQTIFRVLESCTSLVGLALNSGEFEMRDGGIWRQVKSTNTTTLDTVLTDRF